MRVLILGGGGREHALAWKLAANPTVDKMFAAPGNAGIAAVAECLSLDAADPLDVAKFADSHGIDLTVVGPEAPLVAGVADELSARGLPVFGPTRAGARLESSKSWAKDLMRKAGVATASSGTFTTTTAAMAFVDGLPGPYVVKADGLAGGKGVIMCADRHEAETALKTCLESRAFGDAGSTILVEEFLEGSELSVFAITDGRDVLTLTEARDFKRAFDGDLGPNTGGMGAYSPVADGAGVTGDAAASIFKPIVAALESEGIRYVGVLYAGLMLTPDGPKVLEFNARFGDPETQAIIPRLASDLGELLLASVEGNIGVYKPQWKPMSCVSLVLASENYPEQSATGHEIRGLERASRVPNAVVFHASTKLDGKRVVTSGGRVLACSGLGHGVAEARACAYEAASFIEFQGKRYRSDIASRVEGE